jgi:hypothetical protein
MYWKASYIDYAPSGVPDFDQRQDNWGKFDGTGIWEWTYCGPTAVANSLWWMDSRFETGITPPPAISDNYNLLTAYGAWDDHAPANVQPFITDLARYMSTDIAPYYGTDIHQMEKGIAMYLRDRGLETAFVIKKMSKPNFFYIEEEIEKCEDVILLLGIWQSNDGVNWWRVGGHYVTCAGVDSQNLLITFSDPDANNAEAGGAGRVLPVGKPHNHPARPVAPPQQDTRHNNASFVSQDTYGVMATSPSPGGTFALQYYEPITNPSFMQNIQGQNCPSEFEEEQGAWNPQAALTAVEAEYSLIISPADWYFKPPQRDYAPSGVPDFDQKQWLIPTQNWTNPYPPEDTWSHCGPVAVANSLWWLDSEFEPNPKPPSEINDGFGLVQSYSPTWDDHDPQNVPYLVEDLAYWMDTNGMRTGSQHCGTEVHDMEYGIDLYLSERGMDWKFYEHTEKAPFFEYLEEEIKKCEDVILLLGFWQNYGTETEPYWVRVGGHYVTCAGVDSTNRMLAISDPYIDNAEWGFPGEVIPSTHPHTGTPETLHNNATYVSHDFYMVGPSNSPGGPWGIYQYPAEDTIDNFGSCQNTPEEFLHYDGEYIPSLPINTEIEYAVVVSCKTGIVAAGCEDSNVYAWDFLGNLQWQFATGAPVLSVALDNEANYLASGSRFLPDGPGALCFFDAKVTGGGINMPLWAMQLPISESYDGGWMGTESKSVDVKYNFYNQYDVVAAATDWGLYLFDQWGNQIWYYTDESPETIVRISQDGNYIVCVDYNSGYVHYFSHLRDGIPGWGPRDGIPIWSHGQGDGWGWVHWAAISGNGEYVAISGWHEYPGDYVQLLDRAGNYIWYYTQNLDNLKPGWIRVDMPCSGNSVVSVNDDINDFKGCDLNYWSDVSDGTPGWSGTDNIPVWNYWPDNELGSPQNPLHDFYTVSISENGDYIATGGVPHNTYLLMNNGTLTQKVGLMPGAVQSVDLTFTGKYGASVDNAGALWFFSKDAGFLWSWANPSEAPFRCVAVSKIYPCMFPFPNHDLAITDVKPDKVLVAPGGIVKVNVTVTNEGDFTESFFDVFVEILYDGMPQLGVSPLRATVPSLASGDSTTITFTWDTTGLPEGTYTVIAKASIVYDEIDVYDNTFVNGIINVAGVHDVAVTDVETFKIVCAHTYHPIDIIFENYTVSINATVENQGDFPETFDVTAKYDGTIIQTIHDLYLDAHTSTNVTFTWDTHGVAKGSYTITVEAVLPTDVEPEDNTKTYGPVKVTWLGDLDGDFDVDQFDFWHFCSAFIDYYTIHVKDPLCDFDNDCDIDQFDYWAFCGAFIDYYKP